MVAEHVILPPDKCASLDLLLFYLYKSLIDEHSLRKTYACTYCCEILFWSFLLLFVLSSNCGYLCVPHLTTRPESSLWVGFIQRIVWTKDFTDHFKNRIAGKNDKLNLLKYVYGVIVTVTVISARIRDGFFYMLNYLFFYMQVKFSIVYNANCM